MPAFKVDTDKMYEALAEINRLNKKLIYNSDELKKVIGALEEWSEVYSVRAKLIDTDKVITDCLSAQNAFADTLERIINVYKHGEEKVISQ